VADGEHIVPIGKAKFKREGSDVTLVVTPRPFTVAQKAADQLAEQNGLGGSARLAVAPALTKRPFWNR